jgi:Enterobacterial TraT complement resistance protein
MPYMNRFLRNGIVLVLLGLIGTLGGCAATQVAVGKKDLVVNTKLSDSIFVREVPRAERTIYIKLRSSVADFQKREFISVVKASIEDSDEGYRVIDDPENATYQLNVFVTNLEQASPTAAQAALGQGFSSGRGGELAAGAATGALMARNGGNRYAGAAAGAVLAGVGSTIANSLVKDVTFMLVTDILITHKFRDGVYGRKDTQAARKQGSGGTSNQSVSEVTEGLEQTTRIVTTANKANLKLEEASAEMFRKHSYAIAGFF